MPALFNKKNDVADPGGGPGPETSRRRRLGKKPEIVFPRWMYAVWRAVCRNAKIWPIEGSFITRTDVAYITYGINILVPVARSPP